LPRSTTGDLKLATRRESRKLVSVSNDSIARISFDDSQRAESTDGCNRSSSGRLKFGAGFAGQLVWTGLFDGWFRAGQSGISRESPNRRVAVGRCRSPGTERLPSTSPARELWPPDSHALVRPNSTTKSLTAQTAFTGAGGHAGTTVQVFLTVCTCRGTRNHPLGATEGIRLP